MKNKGFTLIDILISVAIISFLSSIVLFNTTEARKRAEDTHMQKEAEQVALAVEMYKLDYDRQGPLRVISFSRGVLHQENSPEYQAAMSELVSEGYLNSVPRSPNGQSYAYGESLDGTESVFIVQTNQSGLVCKTLGTNNLCGPILNPEENDPYTITVGYNESITLIPNQTYNFTYSGNGSEMNFRVDGVNVVQSFIQSDQLILIPADMQWGCDWTATYCTGENGDYFEFEGFDSNTLKVRVRYYPPGSLNE